ncbi:beta-ketoacyl-[acyl-carrier-protein] synthase family protein [Bacillus toyonensis]|uniref:beta-ketoacyl-[acyl-carrier-protein] synthase family protein n=1 Tax=Bacillus toyonensis TaxID=155322 RepID=UPI0020D234EB|nr:beta-ketoacyl-[acyl-carrier-protein] synthase family protein [Bacillus toyonensis]
MVYITGVGTTTSIGTSINEIWDGLLNGVHGVKHITLFDTSKHINKNACEITNLTDFISPELSNFGRATSMFIVALEDAIYDAGLSMEDLKKYRVGLSIGTTMGEIEPFESGYHHGLKGGPHVIADQIYKKYQLSGPKWTLTNACAAGNFAIARAIEDINLGRADIVIAGGVDALSWAAFTGFSSLRAMSPDLCRPFDQDRKGIILGEGAGVLIIESDKHFQKRTNKPAKAKLLGYGINSDAHHITQPDPNAIGAIKAMEDALEMGNTDKKHIKYVNAHGTGTQANDLMESKAINTLFNNKVKTSSIKGHIGHTLGAASAIEAVICTKILETKLIPATLNLKNKDINCDIEVVAEKAVHLDSDYILSNAFAFGGVNSSILLGTI